MLYVPGSWSLVLSLLVLWFDQYCNNNNVPEHYIGDEDELDLIVIVIEMT